MKGKSMHTLVLLFGLAGVAFAQSQNQQNPNLPITSKMQTDSDRAATRAFWTPDRLANAKPLPLPSVDPASLLSNPTAPAQPKLPQDFAPGSPPTGARNIDQGDAQQFSMVDHGDEGAPLPSGFTYVFPYSTYRPPVLNAFPYSTVGKLFFSIPPGASQPPGQYVCSGSVDMNNHTVLTARHCVFDVSTGVWYNSFVFYPAYNSGSNPTYGGAWYANTEATWLGGSWDYDIAFMQMADSVGYGCGGDRGRTIGSYTGWLGATWNGDFSQRQWDIFGYPQAAPFDGNRQYETSAATGVLNPFGATNIAEVGSNQTGGTSGGPWIIGLDPLAATDPPPSNNTIGLNNVANSVNSFKWTSPSQPYAINGPEFQTYNFLNLFNYYNGLTCR